MRAGNDYSVSLPPEIWAYIASLLELDDLSPLCLLSRPFYHAFLSCQYQCVTLLVPHDCNVKQELALLRALRNPLIKEKIRELHFNSHCDTDLISALDLEGWKSYFPRYLWSPMALLTSGRMGNAKHQAIREIIKGATSILCNITYLSMDLDPQSNTEILDTLWRGCSQTLANLTLRLGRRIRMPDHTFGLGLPCPNLRSLNVTISADFPRSPELLNDIRSLIPEDGGCMEELTIRLCGHQPAFMNSISFGSLTKLSLYDDYTAISSILTFISLHRDTLRDITLQTMPAMDLYNRTFLNASILTSLSVPADQLLGQNAEMFPFLSRCTCLRTFSLSHDRHFGKESSEERMPLFFNLVQYLPPSLTRLILTSLILDFQLLLSMSLRLPDIQCLALSDCYAANKEFRPLFPGSTHRRAWVFRFKGLAQASLKASAQEDLVEDSLKANLKHFCDSMIDYHPCCTILW